MSQQRTETTYRSEQWRAVSTGILETAGTTFLLLIAERWYRTGEDAKSLIAIGGSLGLLLSPWVVTFVEHRRWETAKAASRIAAMGCITFLLAALFPHLWMFTACSVVGMACASAAIPLMTQIYQENYPEKDRGRRFSRTLIIRIGTAALFSELAGRALTNRIEAFQWLLVVFALAFASASFFLSRIPSRVLTSSGHSSIPSRAWPT
ncbi:MAG: hypothetical protein ACK4UN_18525 [Limisphaerales bacterium]